MGSNEPDHYCGASKFQLDGILKDAPLTTKMVSEKTTVKN